MRLIAGRSLTARVAPLRLEAIRPCLSTSLEKDPVQGLCCTHRFTGRVQARAALLCGLARDSVRSIIACIAGKPAPTQEVNHAARSAVTCCPAPFMAEPKIASCHRCAARSARLAPEPPDRTPFRATQGGENRPWPPSPNASSPAVHQRQALAPSPAGKAAAASATRGNRCNGTAGRTAGPARR